MMNVKRLPQQVLIVDDSELQRQFTAELCGDILLESALDIAGKLGLGVVAEGVETLQDWMLLRDLGCGEVQGYFVAKPMPGDALLAWWRSNDARLRDLVGATS